MKCLDVPTLEVTVWVTVCSYRVQYEINRKCLQLNDMQKATQLSGR
jgi:hypothetical protein